MFFIQNLLNILFSVFSTLQGGISTLGSGAWGTALACILNKKTNISLWAYEKEIVTQINKHKINKTYLPGIKIPSNVSATNNLEELKKCKFIFICIPSQFIKKIILEFKKFYKKSFSILKKFLFINLKKL